MAIVPVIMCGGSGVRLWPASRPARPKQFIPLIGALSSFQETVLRVSGVEGAGTPLVVAGIGHARMLREQLAKIGGAAQLVLEPQARDSAPAMAAAALTALREDADAILVVVASDHHVPDAAAFRAAVVSAAADAASTGRIVTLGVRPDHPSTAYGYIQAGKDAAAVKPVARFVEKPSLEKAQAYLDDGYLWNSGNFIVRADRLLSELDLHAPALRPAVAAAVEQMGEDGRLGPSFADAPKISIDYAVMERTSRAAVLPVDFVWSDLGAWDAIHKASPRDGDGNALTGDVWTQGASDSLIRTSGPTVVAVGLHRIAVVADVDAVLVCSLDAAQDVKLAVDRMKASGAKTADLAPAEDLAATAARLNGWLQQQALPLWATLGLDWKGSGFAEGLDADAHPVPGPRRARVQPRQAQVFARAEARGWGGPGRQAAEVGLAAFEARYRRSDGLFRTLCADDGTVLDDRALIYDQAFALLAWSAMGWEGKALDLLDHLDAVRAPAGGFMETGEQPYLSNPHMHLLEAALAWMDAGQSALWADLADEIAKLALTRFIDSEGGFLREFFTADWSPAAGDAGRRVEPGHQFEWAVLLARWSAARGDPSGLQAAHRLYRAGRAGVDAARGVAVDAITPEGTVLEPTARLWPQTEWLKAALILNQSGDILLASQAMSAYLQTPVPGLWRDRLSSVGQFDPGVSPASSLYHIAAAIGDLTDHVGSLAVA